VPRPPPQGAAWQAKGEAERRWTHGDTAVPGGGAAPRVIVPARLVPKGRTVLFSGLHGRSNRWP